MLENVGEGDWIWRNGRINRAFVLAQTEMGSQLHPLWGFINAADGFFESQAGCCCEGKQVCLRLAARVKESFVLPSKKELSLHIF